MLNPDFAIAKSARRAATPQLVASSPADGLRQNLHDIFLRCVSRRYYISNANFGFKTGVLTASIIVLCVAVVLIFGNSICIAKSGGAKSFIIKEIPICKNNGNQAHPAFYGNIVVWEDKRNSRNKEINEDIYMYDLLTNTEKGISLNPFSGEGNPAVFKDKIVWMDRRNGNNDIYMYDLSTNTETPICTNPSGQSFPCIYGDKIVWQDTRNGNWDIYMYSLKSGK